MYFRAERRRTFVQLAFLGFALRAASKRRVYLIGDALRLRGFLLLPSDDIGEFVEEMLLFGWRWGRLVSSKLVADLIK